MSRQSASILHNADNSWTISFADGSNNIANVELLRFNDGTVRLIDRDSDIYDSNFETAEVLLQNISTGNIVRLGSNSTATFSYFDKPHDTFVGYGDLDNDGVSEVLYRSSSTGALSYTGQFRSVESNPLHPIGASGALAVAAIADFNGDRTADILLRDTISSGNLVFRFVQNGA